VVVGGGVLGWGAAPPPPPPPPPTPQSPIPNPQKIKNIIYYIY